MLFDHQDTVARLDALPLRLRAAVGVVCLQRVLPIADGVTDTALVREALARLGRWADGEDVAFREVQDIVDAQARRAEAANASAVANARELEAERDAADDDVDDDDDDDDDGDDDGVVDVAREPTRGALDRMMDALEDGVRALARIVDHEEKTPSVVVATAMAAACNVVQRFGHYCDVNDLLAFDELAWQKRVLAEAEKGGDVRTLLGDAPSWREQLDEAF